MRDQSADTGGAGVPNFNTTEEPTVAANAATGGTTNRFAIDEQNNHPSTSMEGHGLGLDFLATDYNHTDDTIDITDASNAIHASDGHNAIDSNSVSGHVQLGRGQTYGDGLPWPSEIVASCNNW